MRGQRRTLLFSRADTKATLATAYPRVCGAAVPPSAHTSSEVTETFLESVAARRVTIVNTLVLSIVRLVPEQRFGWGMSMHVEQVDFVRVTTPSITERPLTQCSAAPSRKPLHLLTYGRREEPT